MRKETKNPDAEGTLLRQIIAAEPIRGMNKKQRDWNNRMNGT
jgi:hypothetical protein